MPLPNSPASRLHLMLVMGAGLVLSSAHARAADPDPRDLLRAVEAARETIQSGKVKLELTYRDRKFAKHPGPPTRLEVSFDGPKRRFDQFTRESTFNLDVKDPLVKLREFDYDPGRLVAAGFATFHDAHIRCSWDGAQMVECSPRGGAIIRDGKRGSGYYLFDLRTLGITPQHEIPTTVGDALADRPARTITLIGREEVAGRPTWHVRIAERFQLGLVERHHWIEDVPGYPVWKTEEVVGGHKSVITASYRQPVADNPIPLLVQARTFAPNGDEISLETLAVETAEWNVPVDPAAWTLKTMGMPVGTMVIDDRYPGKVRYFDGEGLRRDLYEEYGFGRSLPINQEP